MTKTNPKTAVIISCLVAAALLAISVWAKYGGQKKLRLPTYVTHSDASPSDIDPVGTKENEKNQPDDEETKPLTEKVKIKFVTIKTDTFIRADADSSSEKTEVITAGTEAEYISSKGSFYKIKYSKYKEGWILKSCCKLYEKEVEIKHIPKKVYGEPYGMKGTKEGEKLGEILHHYNAVGASVAVIKDGHVSYHFEYGYADRENKVYVSKETKFRIASISKVFTAMLAMTEVDDGKLDLDGDLSDLFGRPFRNPKYPHDPVTTRMLLTHTAGLSGKEGLYSDALLNIINQKDYYTSKPGHRFVYSNLSIGIAGAVVEKVSDKTISQYARDKFFKPMGIDASFDAKYLSDKSLVANCYYKGRVDRSNEQLTRPQESKYTKPGDIYYLGQGGLLISAVDLAKVASVLVNKGSLDGKQYISEKSLNEMLSVHPVDTKDNFNQCIGIRRYKNLIGKRNMYYHNGNYYGIIALLAVDPSDGSGVIVITSGARSDREDNTIFEVCNDVLAYCYADII